MLFYSSYGDIEGL